MSKHRILVTGGSGFIGSNLIHKLFEKFDNEIEILNIDKQSYASNEEFNKKFERQDNYKLEEIDLCNKKDIDKIIDKFKPSKIFI